MVGRCNSRRPSSPPTGAVMGMLCVLVVMACLVVSCTAQNDDSSLLQQPLSPWLARVIRLLPRPAPAEGVRGQRLNDPPQPRTEAPLPQPYYRSPPSKRILGVELPDYIATNNRLVNLKQRMMNSG